MRLRRYAAAGVLSAVLTGTAVAAAGAADGPVRAESCGATVQGSPGTRVVLSPKAVMEPVTQLLTQLDPLGVLVRPFEEAWEKLPDIPLGTVPIGQTVVSGTAIADAVLGELGKVPVLAPVLDALAPTVRDVLALTCSVLVRDDGGRPDAPGEHPAPGAPPSRPAPGVPAPGAPDPGVPDGPHDPTPEPQAPSGTGIPPGFTDPNMPHDPATIGVPELGLPPDGIAFQYNVGGVPQFGLLGQDERNPALRNALRSSGTAVALPPEQDELRQPLVLAVLLLTLVGTQLARTWLLRGHRAGRVTAAEAPRTTAP